MLSKNSIFIIGAGSSAEYGYPIWRQLKPEIEGILNNPANDANPLYTEAKAWLNEVTDDKTLDQVISEHNAHIKQELDPSQVEAVIWRAIASIFFELEKKVVNEKRTGWIDRYAQSISNTTIASYADGDDTWHEKLLAKVSRHLARVSFVTFNYDRMLEYKIKDSVYDAIKADVNNANKFGLRVEKELTKLFSDRFYHPHGIINPYPELNDNAKITKKRNSSNISRFGEGDQNALQWSDGLMASCFDCAETDGSFGDLQKKKLTPDEVYILGNSPYGLQNNLQKLPCKEWAQTVQRVICTSYAEADQEWYKKIIYDAFGVQPPITFYKTCTDFISEEL